jgi:serine/threonine protein kinase
LAAVLVEGLAAIHECGIVHRDLKPSNIILAEDGPRIIDFGISKSVGALAITATGVAIGTFRYMSPEHLGEGEIGPASERVLPRCGAHVRRHGPRAF